MNTIAWSSPQRTDISIAKKSNNSIEHPRTSGLRHPFLNESANNVSEPRRPQGLIIKFEPFPETLKLDSIYRIAILAMYELSLQPWDSLVTGDLQFSRPPFEARIIISGMKPLPLGYTFPYSWAISGLHEGMIHLEGQVEVIPGHVHELRVDLLTRRREIFPTPVAFIKFLHASFSDSHLTSSISGATKIGNNTVLMLHNAAGEYTDPENQHFHIRWRSYGPISQHTPPIYSHDIYLAAIDGIDMAARFPAESPCWWLHGKASSKVSPRPPTITLSSGYGLTHQLAARTMLLLTRIMEDNAGYMTETKLDLNYEGRGIGTGSIEPYRDGISPTEEREVSTS